MKKKLLAASIICLLSLTVTACMETEKNTVESNSVHEYKMEQFDFTKEHLNGQLGENLFVDADITPINIYKNGLKQYHINNCDLANASCEEYIELINNCYGAKIEISPDMYVGHTRLLTDQAICDLSGDYNYIAENIDNDYLFMNIFFWEYPLFSTTTPPPDIIDSEVKKFKQTFQKFVNYKLSDSYLYLHTDEKFYEKANEMSAYIIDSLNNEELYFVRLFSEIDSGLWEINLPFSFQIDAAMQKDEAINIMDGYANINNINYANLVFDKNGTMLTFWMSERTKKGEEHGWINVVSAESILQKVQKKYQNTDKNHSVTITKIQLMYGGIISKSNENVNLLESILSPVWFVQYYRSGDDRYTTEVYSGETGDLIH